MASHSVAVVSGTERVPLQDFVDVCMANACEPVVRLPQSISDARRMFAAATLADADCSGVIAISAVEAWSADGVQRAADEVALATYAGISAVILPAPPAEGELQHRLVAAVAAHCQDNLTPQLWFRVSGSDFAAWLQFQRLCRADVILPPCSALGDAGARLSYCRDGQLRLVLDARRPCDQLVKFFGERVAAVMCELADLRSDSVVPRAVFEERAVMPLVEVNTVDDLSVVRPSWLQECFGSTPQVRMSARTRSFQGANAASSLVALAADKSAAVAASMSAYDDVLQVPLQPLAHDLPDGTYRVFETDAPKYSMYYVAVRTEMERTLSLGCQRVVVYVLGAGRGPLVSCALRAAAVALPAGFPLRVDALEKNPHAAELLRLRCEVDDTWSDASARQRLRVVETDGRHVVADDYRDTAEDATCHAIVVSELLGSFADNELSVECVEGFLWQSGLKPHPACSLTVIPRDTRSYVTLVHSHVWAEAALSSRCVRAVGRGRTDVVSEYSKPAIVKPRAAFFAAVAGGVWGGRAQVEAIAQCFEFVHGPSGTAAAPFSFEQQSDVCLMVRENGLIGGLMGYFRATLTDECQLSTVPCDHTPDMYSWFPLFLPLAFLSSSVDGAPHAAQIVTAAQVKVGDQVRVAVERRCDASYVWYEWCAAVRRGDVTVAASLRMNEGGRSWRIAL